MILNHSGVLLTCLVLQQDAVNRREFLAVGDFQNATGSIYSRSWIPSIGSILSWAWKQAGFAGNPDTLPKGRWVVPENLEAASAELLKHVQAQLVTPTSSIHTLSTLRDVLPSGLSESDVRLLMTYLSRDKPCLSYLSLAKDEIIVKFGSPPSPVTEADINIARVKSLIQQLETQLPPLEASHAALERQARASVANGQTAAARAILRRKKVVSESLQKRRDQTLQLHEMLAKIDEAKDNVAMLRAMEASADVLKQLNKEIGGIEHVEMVTDRLANQMQTVEEVSGAINEQPLGTGAVDETEVEDEFEALLKEEEQKKEVERKAVEEKQAKEMQRRFAELEALEQKRKEAEAAQEKEKDGLEKEVRNTTEGVEELHIHDNADNERQPVPAS
jgi:charged multivesicular body protein 7